MIELTEMDREVINDIGSMNWQLANQGQNVTITMYRAGIAAGIERAATKVQGMHGHNMLEETLCRVIAESIRSLLAEPDTTPKG